MEKVVTILCVVVLAVTAVDGILGFTGDDQGETGGSGPGNGGGEGDISTVETVTVPEPKIGERVQYDHTMFIEFYDENTSSGEWMLWSLEVSGQELIMTRGTRTKPDGFGSEHTVLYVRRELGAQFTVYADSSDDEPVETDGDFEVQRNEYTDLDEEFLIFTEASANISVGALQTTTMDLSFEGFMRSYYDPHEPKLETLEDAVYGEGQTVKLGDEDDWIDEGLFSEVTYHWVAERGIVIAGYETLLVNVTADFWEGDEWSLPFMEQLYIANGVSVPVKQFIRTNTTWEDEDDYGYFIIENTFTLQMNGFKVGTEDIPWGDCTGEHWAFEHQLAEMDSWSSNYMPKSGSNPPIEDPDKTSFDFGTEEVIDWLKVNHPSDDLEQFLVDYPDAIVTNANYNATKDATDPEDASGEFWWNLSFGHKREEGEERDQHRYQVLVRRTTTWDRDGLEIVHHHTYELLEDYPRGGSSYLNADDLSSVAVTMTSSEQIFKTDPNVIENFYTGPGGFERQEIDWGDGESVSYSLGSSGWGMPGLDLVGTLTGIQMSTSERYTWNLADEDLMGLGYMYVATLDAETGRLVSIMEIQGTALQDAFRLG